MIKKIEDGFLAKKIVIYIKKYITSCYGFSYELI